MRGGQGRSGRSSRVKLGEDVAASVCESLGAAAEVVAARDLALQRSQCHSPWRRLAPTPAHSRRARLSPSPPVPVPAHSRRAHPSPPEPVPARQNQLRGPTFVFPDARKANMGPLSRKRAGLSANYAAAGTADAASRRSTSAGSS